MLSARNCGAGRELVDVEPQVLDLLQYLIRNRERVVSKDDLIEHVWHGRIVSESTLTSRITAARHAIGDNGDQQRLIRTIARKGIRFVGEVRDNKSSPTGDGATHTMPPSPGVTVPRLPDKPSIGVSPFTNISGDPEQEYFADGITEDIITDLSKIADCSLSRATRVRLQGQEPRHPHRRRELGVGPFWRARSAAPVTGSGSPHS